MSKYTLPEMDRLDLVIPDPEGWQNAKQEKAYLYFEPDKGKLWVETRNSVENSGVPMDVWNGVVLRWPLPPSTNAKWLSDAVNSGEFDDLLDRIAQGYSCDWDGSNWVGELTPDAEAAFQEMEERLQAFQDQEIGVWEADEWLRDTSDEDLGIRPDMTDEELEQVAKSWEDDAEFYGVKLLWTYEYILQRVEELKERLEEEAEL